MEQKLKDMEQKAASVGRESQTSLFAQKQPTVQFRAAEDNMRSSDANSNNSRPPSIAHVTKQPSAQSYTQKPLASSRFQTSELITPISEMPVAGMSSRKAALR